MPWKRDQVFRRPETGKRWLCDQFIPDADNYNPSTSITWKRELGANEQWPPAPKPPVVILPPTARSTDPNELAKLTDWNSTETDIMHKSITQYLQQHH